MPPSEIKDLFYTKKFHKMKIKDPEHFRSEEAFKQVKINLMTEIDVELEKTNVGEFMRSPSFH